MEGTYNLSGEVKIHIDHIQTQDLQERLIVQLLDIQLIAQLLDTEHQVILLEEPKVKILYTN